MDGGRLVHLALSRKGEDSVDYSTASKEGLMSSVW